MITAHTAHAVREAEKPLLAAGEPLMQRAAAALAHEAGAVLEESRGAVPGARVLLLVGPGANGGDALYAGARLAEQGARVRALATHDGLHEEGAAALRSAGGEIHRVEQAARPDPADLVVDGILGTGGRPDLDRPLADLLRPIDDLGAPVIAADVPTGVDATTGRCDPAALHATVTVTFGAVKSGLLLPGGADHAGRIALVDLGLGPHLPSHPALRRLEQSDVSALWPVPTRADHKYSRGVVTIAAGSTAYPGAGVLACESAARSGAGMVRYRGPSRVLDLVLSRRPEVVGGEGRSDALVLGPGLAEQDPRIAAGLEELAAAGSRGVIDAGALSGIEPGHRFGADVVLTPHAGEAGRLADALGCEADQPPAELAADLARATGATVLHKGSVTVIAAGSDPERRYSQDSGTPYLASAGTGDVLSGIIGTLLAAGLDGPEAAALGAVIHGRAGVLASRGGCAPLLALDVARSIPEALAAILAPAPEGHPTLYRTESPGSTAPDGAHPQGGS